LFIIVIIGIIVSILRSSLIKVNIGIILTLHPMAYQNDASQRLIWCHVVSRRIVLWCLRCQRPLLRTVVHFCDCWPLLVGCRCSRD
jgi:hypothetical protein